MKGAVGAGVAATGLTAFSGSAAAQQNVRQLQLGDVVIDTGGGLIDIDVRNINILRDFDDIIVTVIGGDVVGGDVIGGDVNVDIIRDVNIDVNFEDRVINVENIDVNVLNNSVVQVAVAVLGGAGNAAAAQGSTLEFVDQA